VTSGRTVISRPALLRPKRGSKMLTLLLIILVVLLLAGGGIGYGRRGRI
jgi:hypothetical protein